MEEGMQKTLAQIEQRRSELLKKPWTCRDCQQEQPPPPPEDNRGLCASCVQRKREQLIADRLERLPELLRVEVGIPPRFLHPEWELPKWVRPYGRSERCGLCLTGPAGVGKTTALCLLAMAECRRRAETDENGLVVWRFISFPAFVMELQDAWRREDTERTALAMLKGVVSFPRLIIDDLGAEKLTDYVKQAVYYLLNEREQWEKPTYLTTNFSLTQLDEQFDSRISSRIAGMCDVIAMKGPDQRLQGKA